MIKPEELRIGNYIRDIDSGRIGHVISIGEKKCTVKMPFSKLSQSYEEFEPIDIIEVWLLKLGFEQESMSYSNEKIRLYKLDDGWYRELWMNGSYGADPDYDIHDDEIPITSVHQLQNFTFALTGSELTIKEGK